MVMEDGMKEIRLRRILAEKFNDFTADLADMMMLDIMHEQMKAQPENSTILQIKEGSIVELIIPYWEPES